MKKPGATANPATVTAWAKHSEYHAATQVLRLTGDPRLNDGQSLQLAATVLDYHRDSGDASAEGAVKATYTQPKNQKGTQPAANPGPSLGWRRSRSHHRRSRSIASCDQHQHLLRLPHHPGAHLAGETAPSSPRCSSSPAIRKPSAPTEKKAIPLPSSAPISPLQSAQSISAASSASTARPSSTPTPTAAATFAAQSPPRTPMASSTPTRRRSTSRLRRNHPPDPPLSLAQTQLDRIVATGHVVITQPGRRGIRREAHLHRRRRKIHPHRSARKPSPHRRPSPKELLLGLH